MPARKPSALITRHATKAEKQARVADEAAMTPDRGLTAHVPARLKSHPIAADVWQQTIRTFHKLDAEILSFLDRDHLIDYCILMEQVDQLDHMRQVAYSLWLELSQAHAKAEARVAQAENGIEAETLAEEALTLAIKTVDAFKCVVTLDARSEMKRAKLRNWRQDFYMTARARAAVSPSKKQVEEPPDPMEQLLGSVNDFINGAGDER